MPLHTFKDIERKYSDCRISAYECSLSVSGEPCKGKYVGGWYGYFNEKILCNKVMPDLARLYVPKGRPYPFLITSHRLKKGTTVHITESPDRKIRSKDIRFSPRQPKYPKKQVAVVLSSREYKLLSPE